MDLKVLNIHHKFMDNNGNYTNSVLAQLNIPTLNPKCVVMY